MFGLENLFRENPVLAYGGTGAAVGWAMSGKGKAQRTKAAAFWAALGAGVGLLMKARDDADEAAGFGDYGFGYAAMMQPTTTKKFVSTPAVTVGGQATPSIAALPYSPSLPTYVPAPGPSMPSYSLAPGSTASTSYSVYSPSAAPGLRLGGKLMPYRRLGLRGRRRYHRYQARAHVSNLHNQCFRLARSIRKIHRGLEDGTPIKTKTGRLLSPDEAQTTMEDLKRHYDALCQRLNLLPQIHPHPNR